MEKAFDPKDLIKRFEEKGLVLARRGKDAALELVEDGARDAVSVLVGWITDSVKATPTILDNAIILPMLPQIEAAALAEIDKIDGKVG